MSAPLSGLAAFLVTFAVHSTLLLLASWLVLTVLGRRRFALQETLGRFALWGALASSGLQWWLSDGPWPALPGVLREAGPAVAEAGPGASPVAPITTDALASPSAMSWQLAVCAAACGLAIVGVCWLARARLRLRGLLADRRPETAPAILAAAAVVARALGLRRAPRLSRCRALPSPLAFGCLVPEVCLPARVHELETAELRAMLAHEFCHLRRRDPWFLWLGAVCQALFPWQVLLVPVRRRLQHLFELRCDAAASREAGAVAVAQCLVRVAGWLRGPRPRQPAAALAMAARPSALRARVEAVLAGSGDCRLGPGRAAFVVAAALAVLVGGAPGARREPPEAGPAAHGPGAFAQLGPAALTAAPRLPADLAALRARFHQELGDLRRRGGLPHDQDTVKLWQRLEARLLALADAERRLARAQARAAVDREPNPTR